MHSTSVANAGWVQDSVLAIREESQTQFKCWSCLYFQVITEESDMGSAEGRLMQVLQYIAPSVSVLDVSDYAYRYDYKVRSP
jgi:hypothetical protein